MSKCAVSLALVLALACDDTGDEGGVDAGADVSSDAEPSQPDAAVEPRGCEPGPTECTDCVDNDADGRIDGLDPECTLAEDDVEDSFATGILHDNENADIQDCFFDGNSGTGDDSCRVPTCCLVDPGDPSCPPAGPGSCTPTAMCTETCLPFTVTGCDCFGCCTMCNDAGCFDVIVHPAVAPSCDSDVVDDPDLCPSCTPVAGCAKPCDPEACILCPGQDESDLPPACNGVAACADGQAPCDSGADCDGSEFCSNGCCTAQFE